MHGSHVVRTILQNLNLKRELIAHKNVGEKI